MKVTVEQRGPDIALDVGPMLSSPTLHRDHISFNVSRDEATRLLHALIAALGRQP